MITELAISLGILIFLLVLGSPLPFCFGGALMYMACFTDHGGMAGMFLWGFEQLLNPALLCIPLFVFAGALMSASGMADTLMRFSDRLLGRYRGSLGATAVFSCAIIGSISGSGLTGVAAIGPLLIPRMAKAGYSRPYATALVANASVLGLLIPPSINMIVYGWATGTSILACFLATLAPALLLILVFCVANWIYARKRSVPALKAQIGSASAGLCGAAIRAAPALLLPLVILGGIYGGIMTPTEAAAVAAAYALPAGLWIYRGINWRKLMRASSESATAVGSLMAMILFGLMLSQQFVLAGLPQELANYLLAVTDNRLALLLLINAALIFVGMLLNDVTGILLMAPLLLPLVQATGMNPVHFGAVMGVNLAMGTLTPPFAGILYFSMRIGQVEFTQILRPLIILLCLGYLPMCFLVTFCEPIAMWLPYFFGLI